MPTEAPPCLVVQTADELIGHTHAMASDVAIRAPRRRAIEPELLSASVASALEVFSDVQAACTRFDPESPLMRANADPRGWHRVPAVLLDALREALRAHTATAGRFDPRVYANLVGLGYDRTLPFEAGVVAVGEANGHSHRARAPWRPEFRAATSEVNLGGTAVDLGGIGKGLAVRWASRRLQQVTPDFLVEAGGDCHCGGIGPRGEQWRIGVEDPLGTDRKDPVAVLELRDRACTTSSTRVRKWLAGERLVHHLIDPRTGEPGGEGLSAVTVVGGEAAMSEVWSKALFVCGSKAIEHEAQRRGLAALWVTTDGRLGASTALRPYLVWPPG